jgi:hypothetical protein
MAGNTRVVDIDQGWRRLQQQLRALNGVAVAVGIQGPEAEVQAPEHGGGVTNLDLAYWHEFGVGVPQRSFLRSTFDENRPRYEQLAFRASAQAAQGGDPSQLMFQLGETVRADIIKKVRAGIAPPLAPSTVARRFGVGQGDLPNDAVSSAKPLWNTGIMIGAITSKVERK